MVFKYGGGDIYFWVEQSSSIMLKAITKFGDPVELNEEEVKEIAEKLLELAKEIS